MARASSSFGFLGMFGRSGDLRNLDAAFRAVDLHPALVPEGVKLTVVNIMKDAHDGRYPPEAAYGPVASLVAYCLLGAEHFRGVNGENETKSVEARIETAGDAAAAERGSLDGDLLLLLLHADLMQPDVREQFGLLADTSEE